MKLVTYSVGDGRPRVGHIEDGGLRALGSSGVSMLECILHGRSPDRQPGGEAVSLEEARLHAPVGRPGSIEIESLGTLTTPIEAG